MRISRFVLSFPISCAVLLAVLSQHGRAATLCVQPGGGGNCFASIQAAVTHAAPFDTVQVALGVYHESVVIGKPLTLLGSSGSQIYAAGLPNGVYVDGYHNPGLAHVTVAGFTIRYAQFEGVLVVNASDVTIRDNRIIDNNQSPAVFTGANTGCNGQPSFETNETGDCGGGLHLIGVFNSIVSSNFVSNNDDGILVSDETSESHDILIYRNAVINNPGECGIVLASHSPEGSMPPAFAPHRGIDHITVSENTASDNGVTVGGSGIGMFSDGNGKGRVSNNTIIHNRVTGNGLGGITLHSHVGPNFKLPGDDMNNNMIIANYIASNLPDLDDTATPGRVGININSGGGGTAVWGTIISANTITDEDVDVAVNTPGAVNVHSNNLLGGKVGVANVCAFDKAACVGAIDASDNWWGCTAGPGGSGCSTVSGGQVLAEPWRKTSAPGY